MLPSTTYRSKRQRIVAVLDMGTSKVCCLIARATPAPDWLGEQGPATQYQVIGIGHQRALGMKSGTVVHMDLAEQAIRSAVDQAELMAGVTVENVLLGVTCGRISSESFQASVAIESAGVRGADVDRVLAAGRDYATREGRTLLHALATGCHLDGGTKISDPCGMIADRLQVDIHSVAADEAPLRNLMLCVERCHLEIAGLAAAPYASAIATLTPDEAKLGATCIDIGAGTTTIAVFADGEFILADALAMGGHLITLDLAHAFSTPLEDAERIKTLYASAYPTPSDEREVVALPMVGDDDLPQHNNTTKAQIAEIIRPRMEEIFIQVRDRLTAKGLAGSGSPRVVLTGGASQLPGLGDLATNILDAEVRLGRPRGVAGLPGTADPAFAAAVGLLIFSDRFAAERAFRIEEPALATGTGYLARVGQWIRESF